MSGDSPMVSRVLVTVLGLAVFGEGPRVNRVW